MTTQLRGFDVMDVSTSLPNDPKVKRLAREHPDQLCAGFLVYMATLAESWLAGERVTYDDAWPSYLPFDEATVAALRSVKLLDEQGRVTTRGWHKYFEPARKRRAQGRRRWAEWKKRQTTKPAKSNGNAHGVPTVDQPSANGQQTVSQPFSSVRPSPTENQENSPPPTPAPGRGRKKPGGGVTDYDALMRSDEDLEDEAPTPREVSPWVR